MARRYSAAEDALLERSVKKNTVSGQIDWTEVLEEINKKSGNKQTLGSVEMRYRRLISRGSVKKSARSGERTWELAQKLIKNLFSSNQRMRAQLYPTKSRKRKSAQTKLLKKKVKELREEIKSLRKELKSHGPILKWYIRSQKVITDPKVQRAIINKG